MTKRHILVVTDDSRVAAAVNNAVDAQNSAIVTVSDSSEHARIILAGIKPSLVLLDPALADGGTLDLYRWMSAHQDLRAVPVVTCTSRPSASSTTDKSTDQLPLTVPVNDVIHVLQRWLNEPAAPETRCPSYGLV